MEASPISISIYPDTILALGSYNSHRIFVPLDAARRVQGKSRRDSIMDRRDVLKSVMLDRRRCWPDRRGWGAALAAEQQTSRVSPTKGRPVAFIETRDGVGLFYERTGEGDIPWFFSHPGP